MAQTDCQACGFDCQGLADALNRAEVKDPARCSPGGAETTLALRNILSPAGEAPPGAATKPAPSGTATEPSPSGAAIKPAPGPEDGDFLTFLGTGTSYGIPMLGCDCAVCRSDDPRDRRWRSSVLLESRGQRLLIDAGPDLRAQFLRHQLSRLDAVFITHAHADHMMGLDDLRPLSLQGDRALPIFADPPTAETLRVTFPYIFAQKKRRLGIPWMTLVEISPGVAFEAAGMRAMAFEVEHGRGRNLGLRVGDFVYLSDCKRIPERARQVMAGVKWLALDMLREELHPTHLCLEESRALVRDLGGPRTCYIHMSHEVSHSTVGRHLPPYETLAFDGAKFALGDLLRSALSN